MVRLSRTWFIAMTLVACTTNHVGERPTTGTSTRPAGTVSTSGALVVQMGDALVVLDVDTAREEIVAKVEDGTGRVEVIAADHAAWWNQGTDRPLLISRTAGVTTARPYSDTIEAVNRDATHAFIECPLDRARQCVGRPASERVIRTRLLSKRVDDVQGSRAVFQSDRGVEVLDLDHLDAPPRLLATVSRFHALSRDGRVVAWSESERRGPRGEVAHSTVAVAPVDDLAGRQRYEVPGPVYRCRPLPSRGFVCEVRHQDDTTGFYVLQGEQAPRLLARGSYYNWVISPRGDIAALRRLEGFDEWELIVQIVTISPITGVTRVLVTRNVFLHLAAWIGDGPPLLATPSVDWPAPATDTSGPVLPAVTIANRVVDGHGAHPAGAEPAAVADVLAWARAHGRLGPQPACDEQLSDDAAWTARIALWSASPELDAPGVLAAHHLARRLITEGRGGVLLAAGASIVADLRAWLELHMFVPPPTFAAWRPPSDWLARTISTRIRCVREQLEWTVKIHSTKPTLQGDVAGTSAMLDELERVTRELANDPKALRQAAIDLLLPRTAAAHPAVSHRATSFYEHLADVTRAMTAAWPDLVPAFDELPDPWERP